MSQRVTFDHPFILPGSSTEHSAGTFELREEHEALDVPWQASRVTLRLIVPQAGGYAAWPISATDLDRLLEQDRRA